MKFKRNQIILLIFTVLFFQSCALDKTTIKSIVQTNSASEIEVYKNEILKSLIIYKEKLDLRNPTAFNKDIEYEIINQIKKRENYINIIYNGKKLEDYKEYFYYAFSIEPISNRNDFLILGLYKLIFKAYSMEKEHQFAAAQYNQYEMQKLYEYLQVVRWKIRRNKDDKGNYLFNTWQNNWQLELEKKYDNDYNIINDLEYIKSKEENIYEHSNFSFEIVLSKILTNVEHSLRKINIEPYEMGFSTLKSFVFII